MNVRKDARMPLRQRQHATIIVKKADAKTRTIEGMASTPTPDRLGDIVEPKGAAFTLPIPLLWQHNQYAPVGNVTEAEVTDEGIRFKALIETHDEPGPLKDRLDEAWQSVVKGLVRGVSIGFNATEPPEFMRNGGYRFTAWEWFELSLVTIPANAEATISSIAKAYRKSVSDAAARRSPARTAAGSPSPGAPGPSPKRKKEAPTMSKSTADKIREIEEEIAGHTSRMKEIIEAADDEEREMTEDEEKEFEDEDTAKKALEVKVRRLKSVYGTSDAGAGPKGVLRRVPASDGAGSDRASQSRGGGLPAEPKKHEEKGLGFARLVMAYALAKGNYREAADITQQRYGADNQVTKAMKLIAKAAVTGGNTTDPSWAAPLVEPTNLVSEFVEFLRPQTIIGKFGLNGIPALRAVPFNIKVPVQTSGGTAQWVGDGKPKPLTKFDFEQMTLAFNKVAAIAVISEELIRHSSPSAELMVRNSLGDSVIARLDTDIVNPAITEVVGTRPPSFTNGAQTYVSFGIDADSVRADVKRMVSFFIAANIPTDSIVIIMRQAQALSLSLMRNALGQKEFPDMTMNGGLLEGVPVIASQYPPTGIVTAVCASEIYLADDGGVAIDMSREASLQMDSSPTNTINNGASPPVPVAIELVSMFQTNSVAIRAERIITWKRRRTAAVVYQTATGWGNAATSPPQAAI
jgi:HK97 family phage major capsid protein/HK97 family phage prohead protease